jgi:hypothetical protein
MLARPSRSAREAAGAVMSSVFKVELYVTTFCRGGCPFCFGQGDFGSDGEHVPIERLLHRAEILRAFHREHPLYAVPLLGGEPLTHPDLPILARRFGPRLPFALVSAGLPDEGADLDALIPYIRMWGATYNPHLLDRFVALVERLLAAGVRVDTTLHFRDFSSFRDVNLDFVEYALPRLSLPASWRRAFHHYLEIWTPRTYYQASFMPFQPAERPGMTVHYSIIDDRFTRSTDKVFSPPLRPAQRSYRCHLFSGNKTLAITEEGCLLPCTSNAQRHAAPVILDLDHFGRLPDDLPTHLDRLAERLYEITQYRSCVVACKDQQWHLDR